jgi:hypothetical protein
MPDIAGSCQQPQQHCLQNNHDGETSNQPKEMKPQTCNLICIVLTDKIVQIEVNNI